MQILKSSQTLRRGKNDLGWPSTKFCLKARWPRVLPRKQTSVLYRGPALKRDHSARWKLHVTYRWYYYCGITIDCERVEVSTSSVQTYKVFGTEPAGRGKNYELNRFSTNRNLPKRNKVGIFPIRCELRGANDLQHGLDWPIRYTAARWRESCDGQSLRIQ